MRRCELHRLAKAVLAISTILGSAWPALGSIPLTLDVSDGYTFSGVQPSHSLSGKAMLPLGTDYSPVQSLIEIIQTAPAPGSVRAVFPGQGGQTIQVNSGDDILFVDDFFDISYHVRITDCDPVNAFGGGLGDTIEFDAMANQQGSGQGVANVNLANLGFLSAIQSWSLSLGNPNGLFAEHNLGVDLNSDNVNEVITFNNFVFAFFIVPGQPLPGFNYLVIPTSAGDIIFNDGFESGDTSRWTGAASANPSVGVDLDTVAWTFTQDLLVPAVPEPASLTLLGMGILALIASVGRRRN